MGERKFELDATTAEITVHANQRDVHLGVFNQDLDGGEYGDAYLSPAEARTLAAALVAAADLVELRPARG